MISFAEYAKLNVQLIRTVNVKSSVTCDKINAYDGRRSPNSVDYSSPETWRYYKNLSGEYHALDTPMYVKSHDNLDTILFSKENLRSHPETKKAYYTGGEYWKSLSRLYPNQERLIQGILFPVDVERAISAKEWDVLSYDVSLIEEQEVSLLQDLQTWIRIHQDRWDKKVYNNIESYFGGAQLALLFINAVPALMNLRLNKTGTIEAHSFHIEQYLSSHNDLGVFMRFLTLKQKLYLYRNIRYLERNAGKNSSFADLVKNLLTERYIPLMEYTCKHTGSFDDSFRNNFMFRKKPLNTQYNIPAKDYFTLEEVLNKELKLTNANADYIEYNKAAIGSKFATSPSSVVRTKDLESSMLDMTDSGPYSLMSVLITEWFWAVKNDRYRAVVKFVNKYKATVNTLTAKDAMILSSVLAHMSAGNQLFTVPTYSLSRVLRTPLLTKEELVNSVAVSFSDRYTVSDFILENIRQMPNLGSISSFYEHAYSVYKTHNLFWRLLSQTGDLDDRTYIEKIIDSAYADVVFSLPETGNDVTTWLLEKNIDLTGLNKEELKSLASTLTESALGLNLKYTPTLSNTQQAMIEILTKLSSYSIQITSEINTSPLTSLGWSAVRFTKPKTSVISSRLVETKGDEYLSGGAYSTDIRDDLDKPSLDFSETVVNNDIISIVTDNIVSIEMMEKTERVIESLPSNTALYASGSFLSNSSLNRLAMQKLMEMTAVINNNSVNTASTLSSDYSDFTTATAVERPSNLVVLSGPEFRLE